MSRITKRKKLIGAVHVHITVNASVPLTFNYSPSRVREVIKLTTDDVNAKMYDSLSKNRNRGGVGGWNLYNHISFKSKYTLKNSSKTLTRMALNRFASYDVKHTSAVFIMNEHLVQTLANILKIEVNICCSPVITKALSDVRHLRKPTNEGIE